MSWALKKRITAAEIAFKTGRIPTLDEVHEAEDRERQHAAAEHLQRLCDMSPMGVFFPGDVTEARRPTWTFAMGFLRGDE